MGNTCNQEEKAPADARDLKKTEMQKSLNLDLEKVSDSPRSTPVANGSKTERDKNGRRVKKPPPGKKGNQTARGPPPKPPPKQSELPYDWQICKTKDGKVFYFNSRTSEKTWDPPEDNGGRNWDPSKEKDGGANSWAAY